MSYRSFSLGFVGLQYLRQGTVCVEGFVSDLSREYGGEARQERGHRAGRLRCSWLRRWASPPFAIFQAQLRKRREKVLERSLYGIGCPTQAQNLSADLLCYLHLVDLPLLEHSQLLQDQGNIQLRPGRGGRCHAWAGSRCKGTRRALWDVGGAPGLLWRTQSGRHQRGGRISGGNWQPQFGRSHVCSSERRVGKGGLRAFEGLLRAPSE